MKNFPQSLVRRFFANCPSKSSIFCINTPDSSLLPNISKGKVSFQPGIATYVTPEEYKKFIEGKTPTSWPFCVLFSTNERPLALDGLTDNVCSWEKEIEATVLAYSKDYGQSFTKVEEQPPLSLSPKQ